MSDNKASGLHFFISASNICWTSRVLSDNKKSDNGLRLIGLTTVSSCIVQVASKRIRGACGVLPRSMATGKTLGLWWGTPQS